jgi:hypothetical protein
MPLVYFYNNMTFRKIALFFLFCLIAFSEAAAQSVKVQQGLLIKGGTAIRLGGIQVLNKRNLARVRSNTLGVFNILALAGDTLELSGNNFQISKFVVTDFADKIMYLQPVIELSEVVIKENSIKQDFDEVRRGYRSKSVFYTGTPHYYYLVLKPMTFIYENFKSEVINARKFNRYAHNETASIKVSERFNDVSIKAAVPIRDEEMEGFKDGFTPTVQQISIMNDYDLFNYIRKSYEEFEKAKIKSN